MQSTRLITSTHQTYLIHSKIMSAEDKELNELLIRLDSVEQLLTLLINDLPLASNLKKSNLKITVQLSLYMDYLDRALILAHEHPLLSRTHFYLDYITTKQTHHSMYLHFILICNFIIVSFLISSNSN